MLLKCLAADYIQKTLNDFRLKGYHSETRWQHFKKQFLCSKSFYQSSIIMLKYRYRFFLLRPLVCLDLCLNWAKNFRFDVHMDIANWENLKGADRG